MQAINPTLAKDSMRVNLYIGVVVACLVLAACTPGPAPVTTPEMPAPTTAAAPTALQTLTAPPVLSATPPQVPTASAGIGGSARVALIKDGNILVWDEATGQSEAIFSAGDAIALTLSDDGQVLAFLRRSVVKRSDIDWYEQSALWAVGLDGENPRELVSAEEMRQLLNASESDSTNIPQMEWIPATHRLLYSGWTYLVQAEGESHATPQGLFLVDTESGSKSILVPAGASLRFVPSPDGQQIALLSTTDLSFINPDGSNLRQAMLPYPAVGVPGRILPGGVWSQDASAFVIAAPSESESEFVLNIVIWRVPVDGSPAERLASFNDSHPDSVTFSPNGRHAAFYRGSGLDAVWYVIDLPGEQGPLAITNSTYLFLQNVHWSPAGLAYAVREKTLFQLCPDATQDSEICGQGFELGGDLASIHWLDGDRFLFVTREPYDLYFGRLAGARVPIAEGAERFAAMALTCRNASEFATGGEGPADMSVASDNLFQMVWKIRNTGTCTWDTSYRIARIAGERLSGPRSLHLGEAVPPGGEIELAVMLIAPSEAGPYRGEWQLFAPDGRPFGVRLPVEFAVPSYSIMDLPPDLILATIPEGGDRIAFGEGALWVLSGDNTLSRIDLNTDQVVATIPVGEFPQALAIGFGAVWVAGPGLTRIAPLTNTVSEIIPVGTVSGLNGVAAGAGSVWVSSGSEGTVYRIDPDSHQVMATIQVTPWPSQLATTQDAVWVTNPINPVLTRIDPETNEIVAEIHLDCTTRRLAVDATAAWVACDNAPSLYRIDPLTNQIVARIAVGNHSSGVAISSNGVWLTSITDNTLTQVDPGTNQVIAVYRVGQRTVDVVAAQDELWVASEGAVWRIKP